MFFSPGRRKKIVGWVLYDFANTSFSVIVVTVVYAIFYKQYICNGLSVQFGNHQYQIGDLLWGLSGSLSMLVVAISSPYLGIIADITPHKKRMIFFYTLVTILSTAFLFFLKPGMFLLGSVLFILGNVGFEGAIVFYNSYLPVLVEKKYWGRLSGLGFGVGYVGSLFSLLIVLPIAHKSTLLNDISVMKWSFPLSALFFLTFSIPFFLWVKEESPPHQTSVPFRKNLSLAYDHLKNTLKNIKNYPNLIFFLLAFFLYIDAVNTIIYFGGIYAKETLHFSMSEVLGFFAIIQSTAIAGSFIFGFVTDRIGSKNTLFILIGLWLVVVGMGALSTTKEIFLLVGLGAGLGAGSIQTTSRTMMSELIPKGQEAQFFGFYAFCGKFSSILGPALFGIIASVTGNQRIAVASLSSFFILGLFFLKKVHLTEKLT